MLTPKTKDNLAFYHFGNHGPELVLLHGLRSDSLRQLPLLDYLKENFSVFALDLPGFGKSPLLNDIHTTENQAQVVARWINKNLPNVQVMAGISMGGIVLCKTLPLLEKCPKNIITIYTPFHFSAYKKDNHKKILLELIKHYPSSNASVNQIFQKIIDSPRLIRFILRNFSLYKDNPRNIEESILEWKVQSAKVYIEALQDILEVNLDNLDMGTAHYQHFYIYNPNDDNIDFKINKVHVNKLFPGTTFTKVALPGHGPQISLVKDFIKQSKSELDKIISSLSLSLD